MSHKMGVIHDATAIYHFIHTPKILSFGDFTPTGGIVGRVHQKSYQQWAPNDLEYGRRNHSFKKYHFLDQWSRDALTQNNHRAEYIPTLC